MVKKIPTKKLWFVIGALVFLSVIGVALMTMPRATPQHDAANNPPPVNNTTSQPNQPRQQLAAEGRYTVYSEDKVPAQGYSTTLIFFHAPWCPQCREFEKNITAGTVPYGVQILKTDYDTSTALKKKYGVTLQTTFVQIDANGTQLKKWVGYTSDHKLETLLNEFRG